MLALDLPVEKTKIMQQVPSVSTRRWIVSSLTGKRVFNPLVRQIGNTYMKSTGIPNVEMSEYHDHQRK